jgi:hypothetical protein
MIYQVFSLISKNFFEKSVRVAEVVFGAVLSSNPCFVVLEISTLEVEGTRTIYD